VIAGVAFLSSSTIQSASAATGSLMSADETNGPAGTAPDSGQWRRLDVAATSTANRATVAVRPQRPWRSAMDGHRRRRPARPTVGQTARRHRRQLRRRYAPTDPRTAAAMPTSSEPSAPDRASHPTRRAHL
jgi:hypothetical protein